jgi:hypothetical protein
VISLNSHHPAQSNRSPQRRLSATLPLVAALLTVLGVSLGSALGATNATAAVVDPSPGTQTGVADVTVPRAVGPVNSLSHEFRLASDNSLITGVPTLLGGQRVILRWNGVPSGDWLGTLTRSDGVVVELGLVTAAEDQLRHALTLPAGLATGSYTVAFTQNGRELRPTFGFAVAGAPPATGPSTPPSPAASAGAGTTARGASTTSAGNASGPAGAGAASGSIIAPAGGAADSGAVVAPAGGAAASGAKPAGAPGVKAVSQPLISVGGVRTAYQGSVNPFNSAIDVTYSVANTGNVPIRGGVVIVVRGPVAVVARSDSREIGAIAPGQSRTFTTRVSGADQAGLLRVAVRLLPRTSQAAMLPPVDREASAWAVPWSALALLGAGGGAAWFVRRRRQMGAGAGSDLDGSDRGDGSEQLVGSTPAGV